MRTSLYVKLNSPLHEGLLKNTLFLHFMQQITNFSSNHRLNGNLLVGCVSGQDERSIAPNNKKKLSKTPIPPMSHTCATRHRTVMDNDYLTRPNKY